VSRKVAQGGALLWPAGVSVVTVSAAGTVVPVGDWDTHGKNDGRKFGQFEDYRQRLPAFPSGADWTVDTGKRGLLDHPVLDHFRYHAAAGRIRTHHRLRVAQHCG